MIFSYSHFSLHLEDCIYEQETFFSCQKNGQEIIHGSKVQKALCFHPIQTSNGHGLGAALK